MFDDNAADHGASDEGLSTACGRKKPKGELRASPASAKPHRASARLRIVDGMIDHRKADAADQGNVFAGSETRMIEGVAPIAADGFAMFRPGVEHQQRPVGRMLGKHRKHQALVAGIEVKETVPCQDAVEAVLQRQLPHVGHHPLLIGQTAPAQRYHGGRGIHAGHMQATLVHVLCHGSSRTAAKVQYACACGQAVDETVVPDLIVPPAILAVAIPRCCVLLVMFDDATCELRHWPNVGPLSHSRNGSFATRVDQVASDEVKSGIGVASPMSNAKPRVGTGAHFAPLRCTDISSRTSPAALFRARITRDEMLVLFFGAEIHRADDPVDQAGS